MGWRGGGQCSDPPHILHQTGKVMGEGPSGCGGETELLILLLLWGMLASCLLHLWTRGWGGVHRDPPWCFHGVYSPTKVANFVSPLSSLCRFSHNQRATAFRHPVTGQISPENVDFLLQEQWVIDFCISVMVLFVWRICDALGVFVFPPAVIWCVSSEIASVFFHLIFDVSVEHMRFDFINLMW